MSTLPTTRTEDTFTGRRVTIKTIRSFDDVTARLYASIGTLADAGWPSVTSYLQGRSLTKEGFIASAKRLWTPLYGIAPGRRIKRVIVGNPMSAAMVLAHDLKAGLAAPAEMLILEGEGGEGTEILFQLFSALAAGVESGEGLLQASLNLDDKIQHRVDHITA